jgi:hypothetical protein
MRKRNRFEPGKKRLRRNGRSEQQRLEEILEALERKAKRRERTPASRNGEVPQ